MANNFFADPNCKALWLFEPGALDTDSIGSNALEDRYSEYDPSAEATTAGLYKEGSGAVQTRDPSGAGTIQWKRILDDDLDAGFPTKAGDTTIKISVACWFRYTEDQDLGVNSIGRVITKYADASSQRVFEFGTSWDATEWWLGVYYGTSSARQQIFSSGAALEHGVWYHVGLALDGVNKTYLIRSYNASTDTAQTFSGSLTNEMRTGTGYIDIGRGHDGYIDEMAVFNDLKTASDFDAMRSGSYEPPVSLETWSAYHTHSAETPFMGTLEVQGSHHVLWSTNVWPIDLIVANSHHELTSPNTYTILDLSVQDAAHVSAADALTIMHNWVDNHLVNGLMPGLKLAAQTGKRLSLTRPLPGLQLTAWSGAQLIERLPTMEVSATSSHESLMTGSGRLSEMRIDARSASRADALKLPTIEGSASVQAPLTGSLDRRLPGLQITAEGAAARLGVLTGTLPTLDASLIATAEMLMSLDSHLPVLRGSALASLATTIDLDALLPAIGMTGGNVVDGSMSLSGTLPTIAASVIINALAEDEPAVEYHILRHVR